MGNTDSSPAEAPPAPPSEPVEPPSILSSATKAMLLRCHHALAGPEATLPAQALEDVFLLPPRLVEALQGQNAAQFVATVARFSNPSAQSRREFLFELFASGEGDLDASQAMLLLETSCSVAVVVAKDFGGAKIELLKGSSPPGATVEFLARDMIGSRESVGLELFERYTSLHAPAVADGAAILLTEKARMICASQSEAYELSDAENTMLQARICRMMPSIDASDGSDIFSPELLWGLGLMWNGEVPMSRLFSTNSNGYSMQTMVQKVQGYAGPTIVLVRDQTGRVFGGHISAQWRDGCASKRTHFVQDSNAYLFSLTEPVGIYKAISGSKNHLYLETEAGFKHEPGFGMGGEVDDFRLFIDHRFDKVCWKSQGPSFEDSVQPLTCDVTGLIACEVWGCGGKEADQAKKRTANAAAAARTAYLRDLAKKSLVGQQETMDMLGIGVGEEVRSRAGLKGRFEAEGE